VGSSPPQGAQQPTTQHRFPAAPSLPCHQRSSLLVPTKLSVPSLPACSPHVVPLLRGPSARQTQPAAPTQLQGADTGVGQFPRAPPSPLLPGQVGQCSLITESLPLSASCPYPGLQPCHTCGQRVVPLQLLAFFPQPSDLQVSLVERMAENLARAFLQVADLQNTDSPAFLTGRLITSITAPFGEGNPELPGRPPMGLLLSSFDPLSAVAASDWITSDPFLPSTVQSPYKRHGEALSPTARHAGSPGLGLWDAAHAATGRNARRLITVAVHAYLSLAHADPELLITPVHISTAKTVLTGPAGNGERGRACATPFSSHRPADNGRAAPLRFPLPE